MSEHFTIGEVVKKLSSSYPELTVSKVRFLEDEGLISPARSQGGYRKFSPDDVSRLETILHMQKTYFYPLSVIKDKLKALDQGEALEEAADQDLASVPQDLEDKKHPLENIPQILGIEIAFVRKLLEFNLIELTVSPKGRQLVDGKDLQLIKAAYELKRYGVEPRHLRIYVTAAHRESVLFEQVLSTVVSKQINEITPDAQRAFQDTYNSLESLTNSVRGALLKRDIQKEFKDLTM